jgi:DNA-binding transcriptional LysR family regulator
MKQLQGLLAFIEVAGAGSLAAAAQRLGVTPAAISKNLRKLEEQLGVRLVHRSTRTLRLTAEGMDFLGKASAALRALDEAVAEVSQSASLPSGRVRISVGTAFGRHWVLPALPALVQRHPQLQIDVDLDNRPVDLVAEGYDIGIRGGRIEDSSLIARRVCPLPVALLASPAYLRRSGVPQTPEDLARHECVQQRFSGGALSQWAFRGAGRRRVQVEPKARFVVNDSEAAIDLALADAGIVQAGLYHALPYLRSGRLKLLLVDSHDPGSREFVLHYPHRHYLAPRVRVVVDSLLAHFQAASDLHLPAADLPIAFRAVMAARPTRKGSATESTRASAIESTRASARGPS